MGSKRKELITLEHKAGTVEVVTAGYTDHGEKFLRVNITTSDGHARHKAYLLDARYWNESPEHLLAVWKQFHAENEIYLKRLLAKEHARDRQAELNHAKMLLAAERESSEIRELEIQLCGHMNQRS